MERLFVILSSSSSSSSSSSTSSNSNIDAEKFGAYAQETAELAVSLYPWYSIPSTVHKILIHGEQIIKSAVLPIDALSEEAQECRNKDYKNFRINYSRKRSRKATNEDILHMMLITSDPLISTLRPTPIKKNYP